MPIDKATTILNAGSVFVLSQNFFFVQVCCSGYFNSVSLPIYWLHTVLTINKSCERVKRANKRARELWKIEGEWNQWNIKYIYARLNCLCNCHRSKRENTKIEGQQRRRQKKRKQKSKSHLIWFWDCLCRFVSWWLTFHVQFHCCYWKWCCYYLSGTCLSFARLLLLLWL